jgi:hypothetical protein
MLELRQSRAGWYAAETGLDNSVALAPADDSQYASRQLGTMGREPGGCALRRMSSLARAAAGLRRAVCAHEETAEASQKLFSWMAISERSSFRIAAATPSTSGRTFLMKNLAECTFPS